MMNSPTFNPLPHVQRTVRESAHLLLDLPVGVVGFSVLIAALATGVSLAITLVGVPIVAGALLLARYAAGFERARAEALLGVSVAAPPAPEPAEGSSFLTKLMRPLRDRDAWRASGYFLLMLPAGTVTFSAVVAWWGSALLLVTLPAWAWALPDGALQISDASRWSATWELAASSAAGVLMLAVSPFVIHAISGVDRKLVRLLGSPAAAG
jgi:hypothetical protein